jgi:hypothetical protein
MTASLTTPSQTRVGPAEQVGATTTANSKISNPSFGRAAERYWIVSYDDQELRFSLTPAAEKWAAELDAKGVSVELSFHDHTAGSPPRGRRPTAGDRSARGGDSLSVRPITSAR